MDELTEADIMRLAAAVKIHVAPTEKQPALLAGLNGIVDAVSMDRSAVLARLNGAIASWEALARTDVSGAELYEPPARDDALRDDVVVPSLSAEAALENAPRAGGGGFRTPDVMG